MPENKNNNNNKNNSSTIKEGVTAHEKRDRVIHSLQSDNNDFAPPPVTKLNGNGDSTSNSNNEDK